MGDKIPGSIFPEARVRGDCPGRGEYSDIAGWTDSSTTSLSSSISIRNTPPIGEGLTDEVDLPVYCDGGNCVQ